MRSGQALPGVTLPRAVLGVVGLLAVVLVLAPLGVMAYTVADEWRAQPAAFSAAGLAPAVRNTLLLALGVTVLALVLGTALALVLRRADVPGRSLLRVVVLLPVLVPDFVLGYSWLRAYGPTGFVDDLSGLSWAGVQGPAGVTAALAVNAVPLVYLVIAVGLAARAEPAGEDAARVCGAGGFTVLATVTVPLLRPAIATAAVLVFALSLGAFAIPQVLGTPAGFDTVTTRIYADLTRSSDPAAFVEAVALALLLVLLAVLIVAPADTVLGPRLRVLRPATTDPAESGQRTRTGRWLTAAVAGYAILTSGLPLAALIASAVTPAAGVPPTPTNWTIDNFVAVLTARTGTALGRSLILAVLAASLLLLLGGGVAALERTRSGRGLAVVVTLALVLPGSTLAVGLLITYGRWLGGSAAIILLAYLAKLWALAHRPIASALDRQPPDELYAARISGASTLTAVRTVLLRPLAPALLAAWGVCFLTGLHEVTMSSLLYGPGSETLAVVVLNSAELGQVGLTSALSVSLTLLLIVPALGLWLAARRLRRRPGLVPGVPERVGVG